MASANRIVKNTTYLSLAYVGQKILSFVYFTLIARIAGVVDTGAYVFALAYSTIFTVFVDFGLSQLIQRDIAQDKTGLKGVFQKTLAIKLIYAVVSIAIGLILIHLLTDDPLALRMVYIAMTVMIIDSYNLSIWSVFRGLHKLLYESISIVFSQAIVLLVGITGLVLDAPLEILIIALLCGSVFTAMFSTTMLRLKVGFWPSVSFKAAKDKNLAKNAISFGLASVFSRVFASLDSVLLKQMVSQSAVGFYSIPNKVVFAAQFIPAAFAAAIYPAMSHYYLQDKKKMMLIFEQSMLFLLILSVPMAVGVFVLTPTLINTIFGTEYAASISAMYILVWGIVFGFVEFPIGSLLAAIGQQGKNTITRGVVMVVNIILNIMLIPMYSFVGSAIAALVSYAVLVIMGFYWVQKYEQPDWGVLWHSFVKIAFSASIMGVLVFWALGNNLHYLFAIILGVVVYAIFVIALKIIRLQDVLGLLKSFRKEKVV
jgi:O-antigen/teichoic acid export membrane protein